MTDRVAHRQPECILVSEEVWHLEQTQGQAVDVALKSNESLFNEKKKGCEKE